MTDNLDGLLGTVARTADLGHKKRNLAFLRQVQTMCLNPGGTAAGWATSPADMMSAYRFAGNTGVDLGKLRKSRMETTLSHVEAGETVLLINDVSLLDYCRHLSKEDRRDIGDGKGKGYEYVCNLAVSLEREQTLGVLHDCLISADGSDDMREVDYFDTPLIKSLPKKSISKLPCNHKHIISTHALHVAGNSPGVKFVSVADREFDDYFHFLSLKGNGMDAVIRSCAGRNVQIIKPGWLPVDSLTGKQSGLPLLPGHVCVSMDKLAGHLPLNPLKTIWLDKKGSLSGEGPEAEAVPVSAGACRIILYRNAKRDKVYVEAEEYVELNLVVVKEDCPCNGREPILWVLLTTLPVDSMEQISKVVRIYELRWLIECFFKLLKSGFGLEDLRFDGAGKIARHLIVTTIAAAFVCALKSSIGLGAATDLDDESYRKLKHASKNLNDSSIDIRLRLFVFIAMQGKWLGYRRNGISPSMLMKGLARTLGFLEMMESMSDFFTEVSQHLQRGKKCV
jgi:hypothetical protein